MKEERKEGGGGIGHTFGVRVDGTSSRGLWPPAGGGLCRRVMKEKVLRIDRPDGRRVLKFDGLSGRGLWYRPAGDEYKVSVTGFTFSAIWHDKHSAVKNHTTAPAVRGRPVFPRVKARLLGFIHKRAPSINVRRPQQPSAAEPLSVE